MEERFLSLTDPATLVEPARVVSAWTSETTRAGT